MPNVKLFISYKTDEANLADSSGLSQVAHMLRRELERLGYDVWMDKLGIEPGKEWNEAIKTAIKECNIFLLLLSDKSGTSQWQQREVTSASNFDKKIIPILVRGGFDAGNVLNQSFDMPRTQWLDYRAGNEDQYHDLVDILNKIVEDLGLQSPSGKQVYSNEAKPRKEKYSTYQLRINKGRTSFLYPCNIHLAVGDMVKMRGIDVYANSENAYLQMARIFESKTISALLRYHGSNIDAGGHLIEDTVQNELNATIRQMRWPLPLEVGTVVATSAGHPSSTLRTKAKNNARYIFHAVTVAVIGAGIDRKLSPATPEVIENAVVNTLEKVLEINETKGIFSPIGTGLIYRGDKVEDERTRQENNADKYQPIKSIILPLFASGHGGLKPTDVMKPVAEGVREFLQEVYNRGVSDEMTLTDIHISVFSGDHIQPMQEVLKSMFEEVPVPDN